LNEEKYIKILQSGSREAFAQIMQAYNKLLWVIVGGILNNVGTAEDIEECISDAYVSLWRNPGAYDPTKGSLKTYVAAIAKNKALDRYRQLAKMRHIELIEADDIISGGQDQCMYESILKQDMYGNLYDAIQSLKEPDKEIVIRRYFFDEMPAGIAHRTSIPIKEVKNRLYQSKLKLKKILQIEEDIVNGK